MLEARLEALDLTQTQLGERLGVSQATISRWLSGNVPKSRRKDLADALDMDVHALEAGNEGNYALSKDDISQWREDVVMWVDNVWVMSALVALPRLMRPSGEIYANPKAVSEVCGPATLEHMEKVWDLVLASPFIERVPVPTEWVLRLKMLDKG